MSFGWGLNQTAYVIYSVMWKMASNQDWGSELCSANLNNSFSLTKSSINIGDYLSLNYGKTQKFHWMADFWCLYKNWWSDGNLHFYNQKILYLHLLPNPRIPCCFLFYFGFLDELKALYFSRQKKSSSLQLDYCFSNLN